MATIKAKNAAIFCDVGGKEILVSDLQFVGDAVDTVELSPEGAWDYELHVQGFYDESSPIHELMGVKDNEQRNFDVRFNPGRMPYSRLAKVANWLNRKIGRYTFHWGLWKSCEYVLPDAKVEHGEAREEDDATVFDMTITGVPVETNVTIGPWWFLDWWEKQPKEKPKQAG